MAKGKHASSAEARRYREALERDNAQLQRDLAKMTRERDDLQAIFDGARESFEATQRRLEMHIAGGTSEATDRLQAENHRLIHELGKARGMAEGSKISLRRAIAGMHRFLSSIGMPADQRLVTIKTWLGEDSLDEQTDLSHVATVTLLGALDRLPK